MNRRSIVPIALVLSLGCAHAEREQIPTYPMMPSYQALATIRARSENVQSISGQGTITLTDPKNSSVRLDAAFVFAPPDRARIRAWKFGQAVLDLTITPDGDFLYAPRNEPGKGGSLQQSSQQMGQAIRQWLELLSGDIAIPCMEVTAKGPALVVVAPFDGLTLTCNIDRATLTPRNYFLADNSGQTRFRLALSQYKAVGTTVWPSRIEAESQTGRVLIEARDLELNAAPPTAFQPPARAARIR